MPRQNISPSKQATNSHDGPTVPEHLLLTEVPAYPDQFEGDDTAIFWWTYYCGLLIECGTLSRIFLGTMKNLCSLASITESYEAKIKEQGLFIEEVKTYKGEEYIVENPNPLTFDLRKMYGEFDRLATSMGMTLYSSKINNIDATAGSATTPTKPPETGLLPPETLPFKQA